MGPFSPKQISQWRSIPSNNQSEILPTSRIPETTPVTTPFGYHLHQSGGYPSWPPHQEKPPVWDKERGSFSPMTPSDSSGSEPARYSLAYTSLHPPSWGFSPSLLPSSFQPNPHS
ncbi:hypothetical protein TNIN_427061 [Trichonephila inaurata madagascariensis]|uniref:Uncharacterized protein n=1 Tax=Trichonephila inaurata madagascariensis TaxID=2747483 RepID=A0A8X6XL94_9ARAC|nr:hypothetical protein TNIN_427061 [Trichonephila inaurata madagascariensis]